MVATAATTFAARRAVWLGAGAVLSVVVIVGTVVCVVGQLAETGVALERPFHRPLLPAARRKQHHVAPPSHRVLNAAARHYQGRVRVTGGGRGQRCLHPAREHPFRGTRVIGIVRISQRARERACERGGERERERESTHQ